MLTTALEKRATPIPQQREMCNQVIVVVINEENNLSVVAVLRPLAVVGDTGEISPAPVAPRDAAAKRSDCEGRRWGSSL